MLWLRLQSIEACDLRVVRQIFSGKNIVVVWIDLVILGPTLQFLIRNPVSRPSVYSGPPHIRGVTSVSRGIAALLTAYSAGPGCLVS